MMTFRRKVSRYLLILSMSDNILVHSLFIVLTYARIYYTVRIHKLSYLPVFKQKVYVLNFEVKTAFIEAMLVW